MLPGRIPTNHQFRDIRPLRLLLLLPSWNHGGVQTWAESFIRILPSSHYRILTAGFDIAAKPPDIKAVAIRKRLNLGDIHSHLSRLNIMSGYASTRSLKQLVLHFQPHIVISATPELSVPLGRAFPSRTRPFTWLVREGNNTRLKIVDTAKSRLDGWLQTRLIKKSYREADRIVTPSHELSRMLEKQLAIPVHQVTTIPNPIDVSGVRAKARQPLPIDWPKGPTVVTSARLTYQKGIDVLIRAMALLCHPCNLVVVGRGEVGQYQWLATSLGIESRIVFAGAHRNPFPLIKRAAIYVQPSRWEGFCNAISEAMACGVPVIASNCDFGPREQIEQGCNGILVPPESPHALAAAIDHLLEEPNYGKKLALKAEQSITVRTLNDAACRYRREMELAISAYHNRMKPLRELRQKESLL